MDEIRETGNREGAAPTPWAQRIRARWQTADGPNPLVWLAGILGIVSLLVALNLWQVRGCQALDATAE